MTNRTNEMNRRVANDLDPLSGRPREVNWPISLKGGKPVDATGRQVRVSEFGDWVYAQ